jgi:hypothetical protein
MFSERLLAVECGCSFAILIPFKSCFKELYAQAFVALHLALCCRLAPRKPRARNTTSWSQESGRLGFMRELCLLREHTAHYRGPTCLRGTAIGPTVSITAKTLPVLQQWCVQGRIWQGSRVRSLMHNGEGASLGNSPSRFAKPLRQSDPRRPSQDQVRLPVDPCLRCL